MFIPISFCVRYNVLIVASLPYSCLLPSIKYVSASPLRCDVLSSVSPCTFGGRYIHTRLGALQTTSATDGLLWPSGPVEARQERLPDLHWISIIPKTAIIEHKGL
ncbi:hypothetical protein EV401DRAFT_450972 [Pisolithus croceorrhizus]|nr:hypothetical protein EV401DRAFT_450972 [Pisolithus croceorrhizus]